MSTDQSRDARCDASGETTGMRDQPENVTDPEPPSSPHRPLSHHPVTPLTAEVQRDQLTGRHSPDHIDGIPDIKFIAPCKGPKRGGPVIVVEGREFPSDRSIHVLFGSSSALARFRAKNLLHCELPPSTVVGKVPVKLVESDLVTPVGRSCCSFLYEDNDDLELSV